MKLDAGLEFKKASLDITPLIDVVFLLVLFFAVTTSFISPEDLEQLKQALAALSSEKDRLADRVAVQHRRIGELEHEGDALRTRLQLSLQELEQSRRQADELSLTLNNSRQVRRQLTADLSTAQSRSQSLEGDKAKLETRLDATQTALQNEQRKSADFQSRLQSSMTMLARERAEGKERVQTLSADLAASASEKAALQERFDALTQARDQLAEKASGLAVERDRLQQQTRDMAAAADTRDRELTQLNQSLEQLRLRERALADELEAARRERDAEIARSRDLGAQLADSQQAAAELTRTLTRANEQSALRTAELENRREEIQRLRADSAEYKRFYDANQAQSARTDEAQSSLNRNLNAMLLDNTLNIDRRQNQLIINLSDKILFDSGSADIKPAGLEVLARVGDVLKQKMRDLNVRIGGHTDDVPVSGRFGNNWELSAARAVTVVKFLEKKVGIEPERLSAVGFGEHQPIAPNNTTQGRALNRRIEIVLLPR